MKVCSSKEGTAMSAQQIAALQERAKTKPFSSMPVKTPVSHGDSEMFSWCICNRQLQDILCRSCGYIFVGRQRRQCMLHPNEIHLMDASVCPKCRTNSLIEIKTSGTPIKKKPDEIITELTHLRQRRVSRGEKCEHGAKTISTGCSTEDDDWGKVCNTSFSPTASSTCHVGVVKESPKAYTQTPVGSGVKYDCLKSPDSKTGVFNLSGNSLKSPESKMFGSSLMYHNDLSGPESIIDNCKMPLVAQGEAQNAKPETKIQPDEPKGVAKTEKKFVNTEVQTEFIIQVLEEPKFCQKTAHQPLQYSKGSTMGRGYNYEPKRAVGGEKENSVLRAAIKRSIAEGWNKGLDKMNDLCIDDRRF